MRSVIAKSFDEIVENKKIRLFRSHREEYADGEQKRDFMYVKDAVDATYFFFENRDKSGIYNIGTGNARTWNDLAKAIFQALGMEPNIEYFDMPENLREKYQYFTEADMTKLEQAGCNHAFSSLEDSIRDYIGYLAQGKCL